MSDMLMLLIIFPRFLWCIHLPTLWWLMRINACVCVCRSVKWAPTCGIQNVENVINAVSAIIRIFPTHRISSVTQVRCYHPLRDRHQLMSFVLHAISCLRVAAWQKLELFVELLHFQVSNFNSQNSLEGNINHWNHARLPPNYRRCATSQTDKKAYSNSNNCSWIVSVRPRSALHNNNELMNKAMEKKKQRMILKSKRNEWKCFQCSLLVISTLAMSIHQSEFVFICFSFLQFPFSFARSE